MGIDTKKCSCEQIQRLKVLLNLTEGFSRCGAAPDFQLCSERDESEWRSRRTNTWSDTLMRE
eukprot:9901261-Prorocentrum_lima.AAC.1